MIPLKISIENFMCYRGNVPTLSLESIHVACLSGNNGHGKTALLDSITWALWGKSRARTQEELIHQGQRNMRVELEFMAQDQRYKVTRIYGKTNRSSTGKTELNLSVLLGTDYTSIMGNTIRDTESQIIDIVKMDYETFISTSYLMQGDSSHFTKSKPTERKKILADVLELTYYDRLETLAKTKSRNLKTKINSNKAIIEIRSQDVAIKESIINDLTEASLSIEKLTPQLEKKSQQLSKLHKQEIELTSLITESRNITSSVQLAKAEVMSLHDQKASQEEEIKHLQELLSQSEQIVNKQNLLKELRTESVDLSKSLLKTRDLESRKIELQHLIDLENQNLETRASSIQGVIDNQLKPSIKEIPDLLDQIEKSKVHSKYLAEKSQLFAQKLSESEKISDHIRKLELENKSLHAQMDKTRKSFDQLDGSQAICPLCTTPLSPMDRDHVRNEYRRQGQESSHKFKQNIEMIQKLNEDKTALNVSLKESKEQLDQNILSNERKIAILNTRLNECEKSSSELCKLNNDLESLQQTLRNNSHSTESQKEIKQLSKKLNEIDYNPRRHNEVEKEIENLTPFSELAGSLYTAEENLRHLKTSLSGHICAINKINNNIEKWQLELNAITEKVKLYSNTQNDITACKHEIDRFQELLSSNQFIRQKATLDLKNIATLENEIDLMASDVKTASEEANIYDELSAAFGKNGIQALMIERAVPQIQETANQLLTQLTDNRLSVKLELHEGRIDRLTGVRSEELYINISDEIGTRSYETFSGGEAFRIDFAIRIALSKLLSARSGAPLPILFIDEGFGSQDSFGQERLIEAIQSIQGEFEKIIVITHIDQMKEQFEDTIEVVKTDQGSTFVTA